MCTNVNSALQQAGPWIPTYDFVGGLGGDDISEAQVAVFRTLQKRRRSADVPR